MKQYKQVISRRNEMNFRETIYNGFYNKFDVMIDIQKEMEIRNDSSESDPISKTE